MSHPEIRTLRDVALVAVTRHGASGREMDRIAEKEGLRLKHTTVNKILAGTYNSRPTADTLRALAKLANLGEDVVFAAAGEPLPQGSLADQLPPGVDSLSPRSRDVLLGVARVLLQLEREAGRHAPMTTVLPHEGLGQTVGGGADDGAEGLSGKRKQGKNGNSPADVGGEN